MGGPERSGGRRGEGTGLTPVSHEGVSGDLNETGQPKNPAWMVWAWRLLRLIMGGIFFYASYDKILHPDRFAEAVANYKLLPRVLVNLFALVLPWLEAVCGFFLIAGIFEWASLTFYNGLLIMFMSAIALSLIRGLNIDCGCFTSDPEVGKMNWLTFLRDLTMLIPGLVAYPLLFRLRRPPIFKRR
jgi:uncharacterized membrane protein YphA (DoxX/SURF4 family)